MYLLPLLKWLLYRPCTKICYSTHDLFNLTLAKTGANSQALTGANRRSIELPPKEIALRLSEAEAEAAEWADQLRAAREAAARAEEGGFWGRVAAAIFGRRS